jgi:hypothetical protein
MVDDVTRSQQHAAYDHTKCSRTLSRPIDNIRGETGIKRLPAARQPPAIWRVAWTERARCGMVRWAYHAASPHTCSMLLPVGAWEWRRKRRICWPPLAWIDRVYGETTLDV